MDGASCSQLFPDDPDLLARGNADNVGRLYTAAQTAGGAQWRIGGNHARLRTGCRVAGRRVSWSSFAPRSDTVSSWSRGKRAKEGTGKVCVRTRCISSCQRPHLKAARKCIRSATVSVVQNVLGGLEAQVDDPADGALHGPGSHRHLATSQLGVRPCDACVVRSSRWPCSSCEPAGRALRVSELR